MQHKRHQPQSRSRNWSEIGTDKVGNIYFIDLSMKASPVYVMNRMGFGVSINAPDIATWKEQQSWKLEEQKYLADSLFGWLKKPGDLSSCYRANYQYSDNCDVEVDFCLEKQREFTPTDATRFHEMYAAIRGQEEIFRNAVVDKYLLDYNQRSTRDAPVTCEKFYSYIELIGINLYENGSSILSYTIQEDSNYFYECNIEVTIDAALQIQNISVYR